MEGRQNDYLEGAILAVDAVGYSRLMGKDEEATLRRLHTYRGLIQSFVNRHDGRVFGVAGDSEMAIFAEAGDAVRCALEIQDAVGERNALLPKDSRMPVRIGINYGQVIVEDDSFFGDDVNVAARLECFAEAGEVCLSGTVFDRVKELNAWGFDSFGEERFKNITRPVRVYRVRTDLESRGQVVATKRRRPKPGRIWRTAAAASLIALICATGWGVKVQVEKRRAEAEAASVIADAQSSVATAEAQIARLLASLRESEKRTTGELERVEALLASLQKIRNRANRNEQAALEQSGEAQDLLALLQASEARAAVEQERAETLLAALEEAEQQVKAARQAGKQERQARQDAERRAADNKTLMESLLASWQTAERQAAEERARTQALLMALQDVEARAEAERQAELERQRTEGLLARLNEAHGHAVRERKRAEDLYAQVQDAKDKVTSQEGEAQQLDSEIVRIEALLGTLWEAESRVAAERDRVKDMLQTLRRAKPNPPHDASKGELDGSGGAWQDANSLERAEVLFAKWTEAEQQAADERTRAESLLTALETISQSVRTPPPAPPPKPELRSVIEEPASEGGSSDEPGAGRPALGDEQPEASGPEAAQLAHNLDEETQALRPQEPIMSVMLDTEPDAGEENPWDGTWIGSNDTWSAELTIEGDNFWLEASCNEAPGIRDRVSGKIDDTGQISAVLATATWFNTSVWGTAESLVFRGPHSTCGRSTLKLERASSGSPVSPATHGGTSSARDHSVQGLEGGGRQDAYTGEWIARDGPWRGKLRIANGQFELEAWCEGPRVVGGIVSGTIGKGGRIPPTVLDMNFDKTIASGTVKKVQVVNHRNYHCRRGTLNFEPVN